MSPMILQQAQIQKSSYGKLMKAYVYEGILEVFGRLNIILLQELLDDLLLSISHDYMVCVFLLFFCHHKRPPLMSVP